MSEQSSLLTRLQRRSAAYLLRCAVDQFVETSITWISTVWFRLSSRIHNVSCGRNLEVFGRVIVRSPRGRIVLGNGVHLLSSSWRTSASGVAHPIRLRTFGPSAEIIFGDGCGMSGGSVTARSQTIRIGDGVMIGPDCMLVDSDFHVAWPPERRGDYSGTEVDSPIVIERNVWIGARCVILKGVTIGENAVIGAGSVVVRSVPANSVAAGNPARVVKTFTETPQS